MASLQVPLNYVGAPLRCLTAASTANQATGDTWNLRGGYSNFTAHVVPSTHTGTIRIEGSNDGTNWVPLSAATTFAATGADFMVSSTVGHTVGHVRLNRTTQGSTLATADAWVAVRP
jgi:hypothetical protein